MSSQVFFIHVFTIPSIFISLIIKVLCDLVFRYSNSHEYKTAVSIPTNYNSMSLRNTSKRKELCK